MGTPIVIWLTFWNKFEGEIDKADLAPTTKFAYLKEMLDLGIPTEVDGLPFTIEGYERATNANGSIIRQYVINAVIIL